MPTVSVLTKNDEEKIVSSGEYEVQKDQILFDQLDAQGVKLPHGCLAGSCGSCRMIVTEGSELLSPPGAIETDTIGNLKLSHPQKYPSDCELRLSCRVKVIGDGKISILPG